MYSRVVFVNPAVDKLGIFKRRRVKFHDSFVLVFRMHVTQEYGPGPISWSAKA
jgi:hypothetical protein